MTKIRPGVQGGVADVGAEAPPRRLAVRRGDPALGRGDPHFDREGPPTALRNLHAPDAFTSA